MLLAHPAILRNLVEQFQTLRLLHAEKGTPESRRRLEDITYTLCVSTGTRTPEEALTSAHEQLAKALANTVDPGGAQSPAASAAPARPVAVTSATADPAQLERA